MILDDQGQMLEEKRTEEGFKEGALEDMGSDWIDEDDGKVILSFHQNNSTQHIP